MSPPGRSGAVRAVRWAANLAENEVAFRARRAALRPDAVVLESFAGNNSLCNPNAILQSLLTSDDLRHLKFTWSLSGPAWHDRAANHYARHPRVTFVRRRSPQYYRAVGSARYLINNATFPQAFAKRSGQVYLNTWHGTPLKSMGYHEPGGGAGAANIVRNFLAADYLLAPNDVTETMYLDSFRMRGIGRAQVLRVGTPRIDVQFRGDRSTGRHACAAAPARCRPRRRPPADRVVRAHLARAPLRPARRRSGSPVCRSVGHRRRLGQSCPLAGQGPPKHLCQGAAGRSTPQPARPAVDADQRRSRHNRRAGE